ncbi:hypothetical protein O1Q96_24235 [Streptomyces sp. Qhu-G9]|uniref:hypothetical protein n=1 Tax=Streptomyces sp. Qhu-G9 TaxID=3452799 RepID=UPI0022AC3A31|nr:hypothetical protein [Streptomyces aurantiacus]WAU82576.1 hypothetical protein O1Q96_24235 [Streptomyces aurantiacus]
MQNLASQAAASTYRAFCNMIESVFSGRHNVEGKWDVLVLRTDDGQLSVEIPGGLPESAHIALIRDFNDLVADGRNDASIQISWDARQEQWMRTHW